MLADDVSCNARNPHPGAVFSSNDRSRRLDLYGDNIEVDYRGYEVTVENFIRLLTGVSVAGFKFQSHMLQVAWIPTFLGRSACSLMKNPTFSYT
jgi:glycosylphosphatidylinositol transamidase (GPIT) subunit GPI8